jgi:hypothetical protein
MATRRLPVIQQPTGEDAEAAARPHWQWVLIGAGFWITSWTPLAYAVFRKIPAMGGGIAALVWALSFALAALASGYLVARFGPRTRPRHAALSGVTAAFAVWTMALAAGGFGSGLLAVCSLTALSALNAGFAALGAWLQRRRAGRALRAETAKNSHG